MEAEITVTREMQVEEAKRRIKMLPLAAQAKREFLSKGLVNVSQRSVLEINGKRFVVPALFWCKDNDEARAIEEFEREHNAVVYHVTEEQYEFGKCYDFFYVSQYAEEWEHDRQELREGYPVVWTQNVSDPILSEPGTIGFEGRYGGLLRTA